MAKLIIESVDNGYILKVDEYSDASETLVAVNKAEVLDMAGSYCDSVEKEHAIIAKVQDMREVGDGS